MTTSLSLPSENGLPSAPSLRRGACPSLATPMQTGDGLLVRLRHSSEVKVESGADAPVYHWIG